MKIDFDFEKVIAYAKSKQKYLPWFTIGFIVVLFAILTYSALYPRENNEQIAEGEARVQSLDIRFNTKLLNELGSTRTPTQLGTAGGRDPFSGF